ncbi:alpha/beta hydrolase family protein [Aquisphaera insulae]|uniref:alpha/beta hydrolase family protein n=1 Tax=Aquisphaera insulae TaxID=2712864 RepID=UPI0013EA10A0|nr:acetylxylan esterase [Aquisphaera insulae]
MIHTALAVVLALTALEEPAAKEATPRPHTLSTAAQLEAYLNGQTQIQFRRRREEVARTTTPEQIAARAERLRGFFVRSLGGYPERTPLNARVVGVRDYPGYRIERIVFESRPRHHVTANLYLPRSDARVPGVLMPCGHSENGKADATYQRACILNARNGLAVLTYDPIGQGERYQRLDDGGKPAVHDGSTVEHTLVGTGAILVGRQAASYRVWDGIRALDYLASRPEIDATRLGCTGNSGGGTLTSYLMALDDRIAVAAPSCYITSLERLFATIGPQDAEQNITGQVAAGLDHADYIAMRAPKPTLLCTGTRDFFDIQGSWDTFREAKQLYGRLGFGERIDLFESDETHGYTSPRRVAATRWFCRWLLRKDEVIVEPELATVPDAELQCTTTGQVLSDLHGVSAFDLNAERARELAAARAAFASNSSPEAFRDRVRELLGLRGWKPSAAPIVEHRRQPGSGFIRREVAVSTEPGVAIAAVDWIPEKEDRSAPVLIQAGTLLDTEPKVGGELDSWLRAGRRVVQARVRGAEPATPTNARSGLDKIIGIDWKAAFLSLHLGRPLLGQRATDMLNLIESLAATDELRGRGFELHASGATGPVALHAAAIDEGGKIVAVDLDRSLVSWADVVERGISREQLGNAVPNVLEVYDLPELAARLKPRALTIRSPVDALGEPISQTSLEGAYAPAIRAYGQGTRLVLRATGSH